MSELDFLGELATMSNPNNFSLGIMKKINDADTEKRDGSVVQFVENGRVMLRYVEGKGLSHLSAITSGVEFAEAFSMDDFEWTVQGTDKYNDLSEEDRQSAVNSMTEYLQNIGPLASQMYRDLIISLSREPFFSMGLSIIGASMLATSMESILERVSNEITSAEDEARRQAFQSLAADSE